MNRGRGLLALWLWLVLGTLLWGCAIVPGIRVVEFPLRLEQVELHDEDYEPPQVTEITPALIVEQRRRNRPEAFNPGRYPARGALAEGYSYRVGRGDVLGVIVWNHPELTNPTGLVGGIEGLGRLVGDDGTIFFPFAGRVQAAGRRTDDIRDEITTALGPYLNNPQVDVRVLEHRSQKIYVTGEVNRPGSIYLDDRPLTVLDAIMRAEGFSDQADRRFVMLTRDREQRLLDLPRLYASGDRDELLRDGDVLHVSLDDFNQVFVMGEVSTQTTVPMRRGRLSLAEAISAAEGLRIGSADTRRILVIRGDPVYDEEGELSGIRPHIFQLDVSWASALILAEGFELEPRDIVFIPAAGMVRWNRVINQILPTIQTLWMTDRIIRG